MTEKLKENPGVKPGASKVVAELKSIATAREASRKEPQHSDAEDVQANIPPKLRSLLSPAALKRNADGYEEMDLDLPRELVDAIKERLLKLPLVHRTDVRRFSDSPGPETTIYDEPVPHSFLLSEGNNPEEVGNTYKLDQDLDLDEFVFLSWGEVYAGFVEGRYALLISPEVLFSPD